jgi:hypothetical protein
MSDRLFDRAVRDWLDDGSDRTPPAAINAVLLAVTTTPQERDLRIPRRTTQMPTYVRLAAGIAIVAVVGVGALMYIGNSPGVGGAPTPSPTPTPVASAAPSAPPSLAPGISGWKPYTSAAYGYTMSYPQGWYVAGRASHKWEPGEPGTEEAAPFWDIFANDDGDGTVMLVAQVPAPAGADLESWDGLHAVHRELCDEPTIPGCPADYTPTSLCSGQQDCAPAILALNGDDPMPVALIGDPENGVVTVIWIGRVDSFPTAAKYGGTVQLLKSVLTQMDVRDPQPGETPH